MVFTGIVRYQARFEARTDLNFLLPRRRCLMPGNAARTAFPKVALSVGRTPNSAHGRV